MYDIVAIGNAIVDVLAEKDEEFLKLHELPKGGMALIDTNKAEILYHEMKPVSECSGGSAANTAAGFASLGGKTAYIGKVKNDRLGRIFAEDMNKIGVDFETPHAKNGSPTARCLIFVTHDHDERPERTMATYLGACRELNSNDINQDIIANSKVLYLEGYLWDEPDAKDAMRKAVRIAHEAGRKVAFTLSDSFCVNRHRSEFLKLIHDDIDILFANEHEMLSLFETSDFNHAMENIKSICDIVAVTRSEKGSVILNGKENILIDAAPAHEVRDVTGAGDLYASGFLFGYTHFSQDLRKAGNLASFAASEVIQHYGARPESNLKRFL